MSKHPAADIKEEMNLPSTEQITSTLEKTKGAIESELQQRGKTAKEYKLGKDTEAVLDSTMTFIEEKNKGDIIQKFITDANLAADEMTTLFKTHPYFVERAQLLITKQEAGDVAQLAQNNIVAMKNLLMSLLNSSEFRGLAMEFFTLVQDTFKKETSNAPSMTLQREPAVPISEEVKNKAMETYEYGKQLASDVKEGTVVPLHNKVALNARWKGLLRRISEDKNYVSSINGFSQFIDQMQFIAWNMKEQAKPQAEKFKTEHVDAMWDDAKQIVNNFVPEAITTKFYNDFWNAFMTFTKDDKLNQFFADLKSYMTDVLNNPALLDDDRYNQKWNDLYDRAYTWMNDVQYSDQLWTLWKDASLIIDSIRTDPVQQKLANDFARLGRDLFMDRLGRPSLSVTANSLNNLRTLIGPILKKNLENVPIGPFSGSDDTYDWEIKQMQINAAEFVPDNIELKVWGDANISLKSAEAQAFTYITAFIRNIGIEAKDLKFHFNRKGVIKLEEKGIADVSISGKNEIKMTWRIAGSETQPWTVAVHNVKCDLDNFDVTIKESTHTYLMKLLSTLFSGTIKRNLEQKIEQNIVDGLATINDKMNDIVKS